MSDLALLSQEIVDTLTGHGLPSGIPILVHSGMWPVINELRRRGHKGEDPAQQACSCFAQALLQVVGEGGSLSVPGFFYDYARKGMCFDLRTSPPDRTLGAFPDYFFKNYPHHRSLSPLVSLMISGANAEWLSAPGSVHGNGACSPWARLVEADGWVLCFGCGPSSMTFVHHVEHLVGVPHLYNKLYRVPIIDSEGLTHSWSVCSVRFLDARFPITYNLDPLMDDMTAQGTLVRGQWGSVPFSLAPLRKVQAYLTERLYSDPFALLAHPPTFVPGIIPDDGPLVG